MAYQALGTLYLGLATAVGGSFYPTEQSGTGYARIGVSPQYDPFSGTLAIPQGVTFAAGGTWSASTYAVLYDSATGGNPLLTWQIPSFALASGATQTYAPGAFNMSLALKFTSGLATVAGQTLGTVINASGAVLASSVNNPVGITYTSTGTASATLAATGQIYNPGSQPPVNFRNLLDGADFTVNPWQRGTPFTVSSSTAVTYTADRWFVKCSNSAGGLTVSESAISNVTGYSQALKVARTSANTDTHVFYLGQVLESNDVIRTRGQQLTLSFIATAGANYSGGAITVQVLSGTTADEGAATSISGYTGASTVLSATFTPTATPTVFSFTSPSTVPAGCNELAVLFSITPTGTAGSDDSVSFAVIQLETGTQPSPFERRDIQVELEICQRYCFAPGGTVGALALGAATSSSAAGFFVNFPVQMRAAPSAVSAKTPADLSVYTLANVSVAACSAVAFGSANPTGCHATVTSSGLTTGTPYVLYVATALAGNVVFSADL